MKSLNRKIDSLVLELEDEKKRVKKYAKKIEDLTKELSQHKSNKERQVDIAFVNASPLYVHDVP